MTDVADKEGKRVTPISRFRRRRRYRLIGICRRKIFKGDTSHKCPTYIHKTPPCQGSCPSGHEIRGWLAIARGMDKPPVEGMAWQEYAFNRMAEANPFPATMGRVCPAHLAKTVVTVMNLMTLWASTRSNNMSAIMLTKTISNCFSSRKRYRQVRCHHWRGTWWSGCCLLSAPHGTCRHYF